MSAIDTLTTDQKLALAVALHNDAVIVGTGDSVTVRLIDFKCMEIEPHMPCSREKQKAQWKREVRTWPGKRR